jgi:hypothetical protein
MCAGVGDSAYVTWPSVGVCMSMQRCHNSTEPAATKRSLHLMQQGANIHISDIDIIDTQA